jgi:hypothetical protein
VLQVAHVGGFVPVGHDFATVPELTVYADGRTITHGPSTLEYPGRLLPNLRVHELSPGEVVMLVDAARDAGLDAEADYGVPPVADAGATELRIALEGGTVVHRAEALGLTAGPGPAGEPVTDGLSDSELAARAVLSEYLEELRSTVGEAPDTGAFEPEAFAVLARPVTDDAAGTDPGDLDRTVHEWPGDVPMGTSGCTVVDGEDAEELTPVLEAARQDDRFAQDGTVHEVWVRVLLPGEAGCDGDPQLPAGPDRAAEPSRRDS